KDEVMFPRLLDAHGAGPITHRTAFGVQHLPGIRRRALQFGNQDLILYAHEIMIALALSVEVAKHRLANGKQLCLKALDMKDIVSAALVLERVNADPVFALLGQSNGKAT